jgi:spoIIIJ-associated protein
MSKGLDESISYAQKYLEDILSFFGLNTEVHATHEDDVIELSVPSTHMNGFLIGQRGETMRSLQYMVSTALKNNDYEYSRVNVDIADYKKGRHERLAEKVEEWVQFIKEKGEDYKVRPMNPADRRIVHKVAGDNGLETKSDGFGRDRHVVIFAPKKEEN